MFRDKFLIARRKFDKEYRKVERQYNHGKMLDIDNICVNDPNKFWNCLRKLGPHKKSSIPLEIYNENNTISCNITEVLEKWKTDFESLYNPSNQYLHWGHNSQ